MHTGILKKTEVNNICACMFLISYHMNFLIFRKFFKDHELHLPYGLVVSLWKMDCVDLSQIALAIMPLPILMANIVHTHATTETAHITEVILCHTRYIYIYSGVGHEVFAWFGIPSRSVFANIFLSCYLIFKKKKAEHSSNEISKF